MTECQRLTIRKLRSREYLRERALRRASDWLDMWPGHEYDSDRDKGKCDLCDTIELVAKALVTP